MTSDGLVLLDKPAGVTSFSALGALKRALDTGRVGHAGTLDPFATGLLAALTGRLTRLADLFSALDKTYRAVVRLGEQTDTLDPEGQVVEEAPVPGLGSIEAAAASLRGTVQQMPPAFSAVHVAGKRAYQLAREGRQPRLSPRTVTIHSLEILRFEPPELEMEVRCSKGTYVRSLARDLGHRAGSCAHLTALRRVRVGPFGVEEAVTPDRFRPDRDVLAPADFLHRLPGVSCLTLRQDQADAVRRGRPMTDGEAGQGPLSDGVFALFEPGGGLAAVARRSGGAYRYSCVL